MAASATGEVRVGFLPWRGNGRKSLPHPSRFMNTFVRTARPSDLDALCALARRTIRASYRVFLGDEKVDAFLGSGAADQYVASNMDSCSVLVGDGEVVGFSVCHDNVIELMMIDPAFHRQGLGSLLLRHVEQALWHGHAELRLESFADNEPANAFYRKNGWREANSHFDEVSGVHKIVFHKLA
jgi:ribosomal protein S18 acetylase RimI-like enzyme